MSQIIQYNKRALFYQQIGEKQYAHLKISLNVL